MGDSYPKRGDYEYIKKKTELTFYDPKTATKELVDEVFEITRNPGQASSRSLSNRIWFDVSTPSTSWSAASSSSGEIRPDWHAP